MKGRNHGGINRMLISSYTSLLYSAVALRQFSELHLFRVDSLNVRDDTEIDWKTLPDPGWNFWSAHSLQRRWLTLKRSIKGFEEMTHAGLSHFHISCMVGLSLDLIPTEIMDILRHKKAQLPIPSITSTKKRKITSNATIADSADVAPEAGSSTGPGTLGRRNTRQSVDDEYNDS
jgi:hypothetical protein